MANENTNNRNVINDSSEIAVRRGKLAALRENGMDPFQVTKYEKDTDSATIKADFEALQGMGTGDPAWRNSWR